MQHRIEHERIVMLFGLAKGNALSMVFGAFLVAYVLRGGGAQTPALVVWLVLFNLVSLLILGFEHYVLRVGLTTENDRRYLRIRIALGGMVSLLYGTACFLLPQAATRGEDTFLFIALSTIVALGGLSFAVIPVHFLTIAFCCFVPLLVHYLHRYVMFQDSFYLLMSGISVVWLALMISKIRKVTDTTIRSMQLNHELLDEIEGHKQTKAQLQDLALHDSLTGLGNRRYFEEMLSRDISAADRNKTRVGLIAIDLNDFKPVNDAYGHAAGDKLLRMVADRLHSLVRAEDFCARLGGDEFAVIVREVVNAEGIAEVAKKVRDQLAGPYPLDAILISSSASVGWALYPDAANDAAQLMLVADEGMYNDKQRIKRVGLR
jgi:diguanylate cyclase (GGDEF)-like protein